MCDPMTIAGIALTAGSTVANYAAQSKIQGARDDAMAAERIRQNQLDSEARALNTQAQDRFTGFEAKQQDASTSLADFFTEQQVAEPTPADALPTATSNMVVQEEAKQRAKAKDFTNRTGAALGQLRAFGDLLGDTSRLQARDAMQVGQIGGFKRGSSNVLGYELDQANRAGQGLQMFGDILGGVGSFATSAGLSGATPFGIGSGVPTLPTTAPVPRARPALAGPAPRLRPLYGGL